MCRLFLPVNLTTHTKDFHTCQEVLNKLCTLARRRGQLSKHLYNMRPLLPFLFISPWQCPLSQFSSIPSHMLLPSCQPSLPLLLPPHSLRSLYFRLQECQVFEGVELESKMTMKGIMLQVSSQTLPSPPIGEIGLETEET